MVADGEGGRRRTDMGHGPGLSLPKKAGKWRMGVHNDHDQKASAALLG